MDLTKKRKLEDNGLLQPIFDLSVTDVRKIISSFTNEQLLDIVQNAAVRHLDVLDAVRSIADQDLSQRKLFIRGLGWDTTNENLAAIFSTYGELDEAVVILDKATGKSKGFGFLTYKHIDGAIRALKEPSKKIDGRMTVTNLASAGPGPVMQQPVDVSNRKIYVANVPYDMPADRLLGFFLSYGEVEEGPLGFDKLTGKSKGFALFVYKSEEGAKAALVDPVKNIDGVQLNCKLANDGKKGKGGGGGQGEVHGNGVGVGLQQGGVVQGSGAVGQYGGAGGVTGYGGVAYPGGLLGPLTQGQHPQNPSFAGGVGVGGPPGYSSLPSQVPTSMGYNGGYGAVAGVGAPYSSSQYGGPGATGYGGLGGAATRLGAGVGGSVSGAGLAAVGLGGAATGGGLGVGAAAHSGAISGLGGSASALGGAAGLGGPSRMSLLYGMQQNSAGIGAGAYSDSAHYSLSGGSAYQNQNNQTAGASPAARGPYNGMYPPRY